MRTFDIEIWDTREEEIGIIRNVPAETEVEACQKVAERRGYIWVGPAHPDSGLAGCFAIDLEVYKAWHNNDASNLERDIKLVQQGELEEFRGLYWLYEEDVVDEEKWEDN